LSLSQAARETAVATVAAAMDYARAIFIRCYGWRAGVKHALTSASLDAREARDLDFDDPEHRELCRYLVGRAAARLTVALEILHEIEATAPSHGDRKFPVRIGAQTVMMNRPEYETWKAEGGGA
jgi:hypothetical protein